MDDDQWRADGSFRAMSSGGGRKGGGKQGGGPQFTRVIPKFLQKFQQPPEIQAKFAPVRPDEEDEEAEKELDEVQRAAMDEYLAKQKVKKEEKEKEQEGEEKAKKDEEKMEKRKKVLQGVAELGKAGKEAGREKKRKRVGAAPAKLSNKKLLSFSMDDEE